MITRRFWPATGGTERMLGNLAGELAKRGYPVTVLTAAWEKTWPSPIVFRGVPVVRLPKPKAGPFGSVRYIRALIHGLRHNREAYDLAYVSGLQEEANAAVGTLRGLLPVVLRAERTGRWGDCLWQLETHRGRNVKRVCMGARAFVGPSRALERELQAAGYPRDRIHFLSHGVPIPSQRHLPHVQSEARSVLAATSHRMVLPEKAALAVYHGCLHPERGVGHLVEAWARVVARRPGAKLWLAGERSDDPALLGQIDSLKLTGRVVPVGAFDSPEELLAAADLLVSPAGEDDSLLLIEAMAAGLPVVAFDNAGNRAVVSDGRHGLLVPPGKSESLAEAVNRLLDEPQLARQMGSEGRIRAENEFPLAKMVDRHVTLVEELVSPGT
ncbi:MAG: glycosyltransferase family 4 protein [Thermoguttaceae bacterium]